MDTDRRAEFERWFSQLMARMEEPVNLKDVFSGLDPFDTLDLLSKLASLQLVPENCDELLRLEAATAYAATKAMVSNGPHISKKLLLATLNSDAIAACPIGLNEDPCDNLLTESLTCLGGPYVVFPGIVEGGTHTLRNLSKALFLHPQQFSDPDFVQTAGRTFRALLGLSDSVATKAGIGRNVEVRHSNRGVRIPFRQEFTEMAGAVKFSSDELDALLSSRNLAMADIQAFITVAGTLGAENYSVGHNPLHSRPLVQAEDDLVVAEPGILTATVRHAVLTLAKERGVLQELSARYSGAVWDTVKENLRYLGLEELAVSLPSLAEDVPLTEGIFDLDRDKALYVQLVVDPLTDYDTDELFGTWDANDLGAVLDARLHAVEQWLFARASAPNEVLALTVLGGVGRRVVMGLGSRSNPPLSLQLAMPAHDLETITMLEGGNRLALVQFARAYNAIRGRTEVNASSVLDEYELYRHNRHSYYFSDEALPNAMSIVPGNAGGARREVIRQRDPHGVTSYAPGYVVEVTYLYDPEIPIYVPFFIDQERLAFLVECLPVPVWVVGPRSQDIAQELRAEYFEITETIAYWLWQSSPFLRDLWLDCRAEPQPLRFEIRLKSDDDWSREPSGPPLAISESIYVTLSELTRTATLEFGSAVMAHLSGSDNSGERELVRLLLTSAATLIAPSRDLTDSINQAVDNYAPTGLKKKLLVFDVSQNPLLDPTDLAPYRKIQDYESDRLSDEIAIFLRAKGKKVGTIPGPERVKLINEVVEFLYSRLIKLIHTIRGDELLSFLIRQHEAMTRRMFFDRLTMPTRLACFGQTSNVTKEVAAELGDVYPASTSIRFLIEYVAARPPLGIRPMSLELFDELLSLAASTIGWGFESDYLRFGILDVELAIVPSGRLGSSREEFRAARDAFMEVHASGQIGRATTGFPSHWRTPAPNATGKGDGDGLMDSLDSAVEAETGFTLNEWLDAYGEIWNIGSQLDGSLKQLERPELVRRIATQLNWNEDRVAELVKMLSLTARDDFLNPAAPYRPADVYPWRFGRPLSYIRRPLIVLPSEDGGPEMIQWGNRHLLHSAVYFSGLFHNGRYKATSKKLKELNGRLNKRRGDEFNDTVASVLQSRSGLVIKSRVRKIKGRLLGSKGEHGDIDVLVADPKLHRLQVVECNNLASGRAPHELVNELQSLFKGTNSRKSKVDKLLARTDWVSRNLSHVLDELGLPPDGRWTVEPLVVVDEEVFSPHLYVSPVPVVSLRQLREAMERPR